MEVYHPELQAIAPALHGSRKACWRMSANSILQATLTKAWFSKQEGRTCRRSGSPVITRRRRRRSRKPR